MPGCRDKQEKLRFQRGENGVFSIQKTTGNPAERPIYGQQWSEFDGHRR